MNNEIIKITINGKPVFVFESHSQALLPWAEMSNQSRIAPYLLSLDYHTDTHEAFLNHAYYACERNGGLDQQKLLREKLASEIDKYDRSSVQMAVNMLRHDEHIDAAIKASIVTHSFSIQYQDSTGTKSIEQAAYAQRNRDDIVARLCGEIACPSPPYTYHIPTGRMFVIPRSSGEERLVADRAIEDDYLTEKLDVMKNMAASTGISGLESQPYILDIDLDYFTTFQSANPHTTAEFYKLIRGAIGVTIARETDCVRMLCLDEGLTSDWLEREVLRHIKLATSI